MFVGSDVYWIGVGTGVFAVLIFGSRKGGDVVGAGDGEFFQLGFFPVVLKVDSFFAANYRDCCY